jgi:hypothetical protein
MWSISSTGGSKAGFFSGSHFSRIPASNCSITDSGERPLSSQASRKVRPPWQQKSI